MDSQERPLVSVICITYQHAQFIEQCVESLVSQDSYFGYEIIVRDDASTDGTQATLKRLSATYPGCLQLIFESVNRYPEVSPIAAALLKARGEFVAFCEGDDFWLRPDKLARCVDELLRSPELALVGHVAICVDADGNVICDEFGDQKLLGVPGLYQRGEIPNAHTSSLVIRRSALDRHSELVAGVTHEDLLLKCLASEAGATLVLPDWSSAYRLHSGGVWSHATSSSQVERSIKTVTHLLDHSEHCQDDLQVFLALALRGRVTGLLRRMRPLQAFKQWWNAFRLLRKWRARRMLVLPRSLIQGKNSQSL